MSADTVVPDEGDPQAWNRLAYVLNRPLVHVDPTGHCSVQSEASKNRQERTDALNRRHKENTGWLESARSEWDSVMSDRVGILDAVSDSLGIAFNPAEWFKYIMELGSSSEADLADIDGAFKWLDAVGTIADVLELFDYVAQLKTLEEGVRQGLISSQKNLEYMTARVFGALVFDFVTLVGSVAAAGSGLGWLAIATIESIVDIAGAIRQSDGQNSEGVAQFVGKTFAELYFANGIGASGGPLAWLIGAIADHIWSAGSTTAQQNPAGGGGVSPVLSY